MSGYSKSHKKVRLELARVSDHANHRDGANAPDRARDHAADGRFKDGNRAALGSGVRRTVLHMVPKRARRIFAAIVTQIGTEGGAIALLHAGMAVSLYVDALELAEAARTAGLTSDAGKSLDERAIAKAEAAQREVTAALETSRLFRRPATAGKRSAVSDLQSAVRTDEGGNDGER